MLKEYKKAVSAWEKTTIYQNSRNGIPSKFFTNKRLLEVDNTIHHVFKQSDPLYRFSVLMKGIKEVRSENIGPILSLTDKWEIDWWKSISNTRAREKAIDEIHFHGAAI